MASLVAIELFTLLFAMNTLSAVRAFVGGEGLWSKAEKTAIRNLQGYALTKNPHYYEEYLKNLSIPLGDHDGHVEIVKKDMNYEIVREGFIRGHVHPDDIPGVVKMIRKFRNVPYIKEALALWINADKIIFELMAAAEDLKTAVESQVKPEIINDHLAKIYEIDSRLTVIEDRFSYLLGEASRWLERVLMFVLVTTIFLVEGSGLFLTFKFSQYLSRTLKELNLVTQQIGKRNFDQKATVKSKDELGQLATSINKMTDDLKNSIGQKDKAESESQLKTIFLANMSHEIRTPIGIIMGFSDLLKDPNLSREEHDHFLDTIHRTGNSLLRIINDVLDISRVESGYIDVHANKFKISSFIKNLATLLDVKAAENHNRLIFKSEGYVPDIISTDETRLHQILLNLINNALKFTENGMVEVRYWVKSDMLYFEVTDSGSGIDNAGREKLFKLFSQVDSANTRKHGGSGLGLVLSKRLANLLGGDVFLKSSYPGVGSTFVAHIKLHDHSQALPSNEEIAEPNNIDTEALKDKNILIIDDSADNQLLLKISLRRMGAHASFARDGNEGVLKAMNENPDLVLMDIQMPNKDGYAATLELRKKGFNKPIVALTANAMVEDRKRCLEVGCNDYLTKPIEINKLCNTIAKHLKG